MESRSKLESKRNTIRFNSTIKRVLTLLAADRQNKKTAVSGAPYALLAAPRQLADKHMTDPSLMNNNCSCSKYL